VEPAVLGGSVWARAVPPGIFLTDSELRSIATAPADSLRSRPFVLLYVATFLFYLSFQMLLPIIPLYATALGGRESQIGIVMGIFAFAAMLLRPVAGELADRLGRYPLVLAGSAIFATAAIAYPTVGRTIGALLIIRLFHGAGMGLGPTAGTVMIADLAPPARRGEAMGLYGMAGNASLAIGPFLGVEILDRGGFGWVFAVSSAIALASALVAARLPETRGEPAAAPRPMPSLAGLFSVGALYPAVLVFTLFVPYAAVFTFLPLFALQQRLGNPGLFFTVFALSAVVVRGAAGRLSDRIGRRAVTAPSLAVAGVALLLLARADSMPWLLAAAVVLGVGFGAAQPAILAMAADRVPPAERGRAVGTVYTAWELGIFGGAILFGLWAARWGYRSMWVAGAVSVGLGAVAAARHITRARG
jgi:MFS family permease